MKGVRRLTLVSSSPRRREILEPLVADLRVVSPDCGEALVSTKADLASNARNKLDSVRLKSDEIAVAADTATFLRGKALGKPKSVADAKKTLSALSGRWHTVTTAMAVYVGGEIIEGIATTRVKFRKLPSGLIDAYVATGEPMDKAGAYGIQGIGALLVECIEGDYLNVVGLPLATLEALLEKRGLTLIGAEKNI